MKLFRLSLFVVGLITVCWASDEDYRRGVPGEYSRFAGMAVESLVLKSDGSYLFTNQYCLGADQERGTWVVRDMVVILKPRNRSAGFENRLTHFESFALENDLALRVQDDDSKSADEDDHSRVFRHQKKKANQASEPTAPIGRGSP
jgi:hypothetical protein